MSNWLYNVYNSFVDKQLSLIATHITTNKVSILQQQQQKIGLEQNMIVDVV